MNIRLVLLTMIFMACSLQASEKAIEKPAEEFSGDVVILTDDKGVNYIIPKEIALTSETIKNFKEEWGQEPIPLDRSAKLLEELSVLAWSLYHHKDLKGKAHAEALLKDVKLDDAYEFLKFANYLSSEPILNFAYLSIAKSLHESDKPGRAVGRYKEYAKWKENITKEFPQDNADQLLKGILRYFILLTPVNAKVFMIPLDRPPLWGVSVKDYLDFTPEIFESRFSAASGTERLEPYLALTHLQLNSLQGIDQIGSVFRDKDKRSHFAKMYGVLLSHNAFYTISPEMLAPLKYFEKLKIVDFASNDIIAIKAHSFAGFTNLRALFLADNPQVFEGNPLGTLELAPHAFSGLNLANLSLSKTQLKHIAAGSLSGLGVVTLFIGPELVSIDAGAFSGFSSELYSLSLGFNEHAQPLDSRTFAGLRVRSLVLWWYPHADIDPAVFTTMIVPPKEIVFLQSKLSDLSKKNLVKVFDDFPRVARPIVKFS